MLLDQNNITNLSAIKTECRLSLYIWHLRIAHDWYIFLLPSIVLDNLFGLNKSVNLKAEACRVELTTDLACSRRGALPLAFHSRSARHPCLSYIATALGPENFWTQPNPKIYANLSLSCNSTRQVRVTPLGKCQIWRFTKNCQIWRFTKNCPSLKEQEWKWFVRILLYFWEHL